MKNVNVIMFGALAVALSSCGKKDATAQQQGPTPYPVVDVPVKVVNSFDEYPTNIQGIVNNDVRAKIQGYITEVYTDEGKYVTAGQPLFKLETNVLTQNADASKAAITAAQASVSAAQATVNAAQVEVNKLTPLVDKKIISNVQLETAKANLAQAQAQHNQAIASLKQAQATYKGAVANVDYSVVRSPINGVVGQINYRQGTLVGPTDQTPITVVSNTSNVYAYFSMNEKEYLNFLSRSEGSSLKEKLDKIPPVELVLANGEVYPEKGKIQTVSGQINPTTGTMDFRVIFTNGAKLLANGNSGRIRIPKTYLDVLVVPDASTFEQQGLTYVYKVRNDSAIATPITVIEKTSNMAIVKEGLKKGDKVVAQGVAKLRDKTPIKPQPTNFEKVVESIKPVF